MTKPINKDCKIALYKFCCFDTQRGLCENIGFTFQSNVCTALAPEVDWARFNNVGDQIKIKFNRAIQLNTEVTDCFDMFEDWNEYEAVCIAQQDADSEKVKRIDILLACNVPLQLQVG